MLNIVKEGSGNISRLPFADFGKTNDNDSFGSFKSIMDSEISKTSVKKSLYKDNSDSTKTSDLQSVKQKLSNKENVSETSETVAANSSENTVSDESSDIENIEENVATSASLNPFIYLINANNTAQTNSSDSENNNTSNMVESGIPEESITIADTTEESQSNSSVNNKSSFKYGVAGEDAFEEIIAYYESIGKNLDALDDTEKLALMEKFAALMQKDEINGDELLKTAVTESDEDNIVSAVSESTSLIFANNIEGDTNASTNSEAKFTIRDLINKIENSRNNSTESKYEKVEGEKSVDVSELSDEIKVDSNSSSSKFQLSDYSDEDNKESKNEFKIEANSISSDSHYKGEHVDTYDEHIEVTNSKDAVKIIDVIEYSKNNQIKKITVQLDPEHLGKIQVEVSENAGKVHAKIVAENESTRQIFAQSADAIKNQLSEKGIVIENIDFMFMADYQNNGNSDQQASSKGLKRDESNVFSSTNTAVEDQEIDSNVIYA